MNTFTLPVTSGVQFPAGSTPSGVQFPAGSTPSLSAPLPVDVAPSDIPSLSIQSPMRKRQELEDLKKQTRYDTEMVGRLQEDERRLTEANAEIKKRVTEIGKEGKRKEDAGESAEEEERQYGILQKQYNANKKKLKEIQTRMTLAIGIIKESTEKEEALEKELGDFVSDLSAVAETPQSAILPISPSKSSQIFVEPPTSDTLDLGQSAETMPVDEANAKALEVATVLSELDDSKRVLANIQREIMRLDEIIQANQKNIADTHTVNEELGDQKKRIEKKTKKQRTPAESNSVLIIPGTIKANREKIEQWKRVNQRTELEIRDLKDVEANQQSDVDRLTEQMKSHDDFLSYFATASRDPEYLIPDELVPIIEQIEQQDAPAAAGEKPKKKRTPKLIDIDEPIEEEEEEEKPKKKKGDAAAKPYKFSQTPEDVVMPEGVLTATRYYIEMAASGGKVIKYPRKKQKFIQTVSLDDTLRLLSSLGIDTAPKFMPRAKLTVGDLYDRFLGGNGRLRTVSKKQYYFGK
jgi:hypothetical protein